MGVITKEFEEAYVLPPATLFKAMALEYNHLLPELFPDVIKSVRILEGDGGPGSITQLSYVDGGKVGYEKHEIEEIDKVNLKTSYSLIEGGVLGDKLEKIFFEFQWVPSPEGGSICKSICKFHSKGDFGISEDKYKAGKEKALAMVKAVEAYLQANPNVYN